MKKNFENGALFGNCLSADTVRLLEGNASTCRQRGRNEGKRERIEGESPWKVSRG